MKAGTLIILVAILSAVLTACSNGSNAIVTSNQSMQNNVVNASEWTNIPFIDVKMGKNITFANFAGKTLIVEAMAVWCGECFYQQTQSSQALKQLSSDAIVYISLDIDPGPDTKLLADYAAKNSFTWTFGSSNKPLMDALVIQFGRAITSPSNMPIFIISPSGKVSKLYTGGHTADQLIDLINEWSKA